MLSMDSNTRTRDNKGKEKMRSEDDCELPGPDLKKTRIMSSGTDGSSSGWWARLRTQMRLIRSALKASSAGTQLDVELHKLLMDCLALYNNGTSSGISTDKDLPHVRSGQQFSPMEAAFMWLGGWRPTCALVLVHSVLGGESQGKPLSPAALQALSSELSDEQLSHMNNLQKNTQQAEHELSSQFAVFQMLVTDQIMVKALAPEATSTTGNYSEAHKIIDSKIENLRELLKHAEKLRLQTLQELFNLLTPVQSAKCSIAAFELVSALKTLNTTQSGDSLPVDDQYPQSTSAYIPEVTGKTTMRMLSEGSELDDP
ncbi:hypothetical protein O6H91_18G017400 [Diphasiastrum complanatum]|uniref:Uncharacterized protein n=3 Tax=Diphasiastrum complanatum TaxID=34168 RepID=A0ACC2AYG6_DIPCM|nr:hypothetical protein O6H91_18G016700 [Diphasiastrum complanatum]KAJ7522554.1 hypothetical protein O6H91_18G016700 [Diphasiastrum complanatum]KAJ7522562.1 hypothetical protein O6H91_18G017400 [Diphasiastrum complanatum]